jgi:hypothetical protein
MKSWELVGQFLLRGHLRGVGKTECMPSSVPTLFCSLSLYSSKSCRVMTMRIGLGAEQMKEGKRLDSVP